MSVSRRRFLSSAAVVSAAFALKPAMLAFGKESNWSNDAVKYATNAGIPSYSREMFEPFVGDTFRVRVGKQMVDLKLVAVTDAKPKAVRPGTITTGRIPRTDCFAMRFHAAQRLPGKVHTLNHSKLGEIDLFMVQTKEGSKFLQTAIINHVV